MKRSISVIALLFTSVSAIIGSGWLFSSYYASSLAGPSSLISWLIGGFVAIVVAFVFGELCSLLPVSGFSTRVPQYTHGTIVGFLFSWIIWLSYAGFVPAEVQAIIQYLAFYFPNLVVATGGLSTTGYVVATALMLLVSFINGYSLSWLIRSNNYITVLKMVIPLSLTTVVLILFFSVDKTIHPAGSTFMPLGVKGMLAALTSGGIVFAFNGFKQAAEMAGEAKNPRFALPFAIIGSIVACLVIFLLLQVTFLVSLTPENLAGGWGKLTIPSGSSPLAAILSQDKLGHLLPLLYLCAFLAPLAAAMMYCSSASRSIYGMSKNKYLPHFFQKLTPHGSPLYGVIATFVVGMMMFAPLPGWDKIAAFLSSLIVLTYSVGPVTLLALRQQLPHQPKIFKLPFAYIWSTVAFYLCTLLVFWCGWDIISKLTISFIVIFIVLVSYHFYHRGRKNDIVLDWKESIWLWVYLGGLSLFSYLGSFGNGKDILHFGIDFAVLFVFSVLVIFLALKFKLRPSETRQYIEELKAEIQ